MSNSSRVEFNVLTLFLLLLVISSESSRVIVKFEGEKGGVEEDDESEGVRTGDVRNKCPVPKHSFHSDVVVLEVKAVVDTAG